MNILSASLVLALALGAVGIDKSGTNQQSEVLRLKSHGQTLAELRLLNGAKLKLFGDITTLNNKQNIIASVSSTNGSIAEISVEGGRPIRISAESLEYESTKQP